ASGRRSGKLANGLRPAAGEVVLEDGSCGVVNLVEEETGAVLGPANGQVPWREPRNGLGIAAFEGIKDRREVRGNGHRPAAVGRDAGTQRWKLEALGADGPRPAAGEGLNGETAVVPPAFGCREQDLAPIGEPFALQVLDDVPPGQLHGLARARGHE